MEKTKSSQAFFYISRFIIFALVLSLSSLFCSFMFRACNIQELHASNVIKIAPADVIIDAGHGGADAGASGLGGEAEKEINLAVSEMIYNILDILGYSAVMTRTGDYMLSYADPDTGKENGTNKMRDLRGRLAYADENPYAVFLSIHMNKFSDPRYYGLQVYYSKNNNRSEKLAQLIQEKARLNLDPENDRKIKMAGDNIYLLKKITIPAVIVECGFLSNENETFLLMQHDYQMKLAAAILCGVTEEINLAAH